MASLLSGVPLAMVLAQQGFDFWTAAGGVATAISHLGAAVDVLDRFAIRQDFEDAREVYAFANTHQLPLKHLLAVGILGQ